MKIVATIEARMTSSRLPGKVLMPANGQPMLAHMIARLKQVREIHEIVVATTVNAQDDGLERLARELGVGCYRGSEADVMARVLEAAESRGADVIVQTTGDCPILDPRIVRRVIEDFLRGGADYVSNTLERCYPDGMDVAAMATETLRRSFSMTQDPHHREHVTLHIKRSPEVFKLRHVPAPEHLRFPKLGLTLDEPADYELLKRIIEHFGSADPYFSCDQVIELLKSKPEWVAINQDVRRKG